MFLKIYIYNDYILLEDIAKEKIELKRDLGLKKQGGPRDKKKQTIDNIKIFTIREKKLLKCLMIMLGICLKVFMI